jgi:hypothetical protein
MAGDEHLHAVVHGAIREPAQLRLAVVGAVVDGDQAGQAEHVTHVVDVPVEVGDAGLERLHVFLRKVRDLDAAVVLDGAHGRDDHRRRRPQARLAALDVHELLGPEVGAEPGLGDDVVRELQRRARRHHRVAAMRDVGERSAVDERRVVFQRLHQVWRERVLQHGRHRAVGLEVARQDRLLVARAADDDPAQPVLEVPEAGREAEDRHDFRGHDDVEAILAREAVSGPAEADRDLAQGAVIDVDHAPPAHAARVEVERIAVVDVVVDQRGEQVVGDRDRAEVAGEVEVDVLHRHDLRITAAGRAALHAEHRPERRFAQADERLLADAAECVTEPHGHRRLALAGRRRRDRGDQDELAVRATVETGAIIERDLGLVVAERLEFLRRYSQPFHGERNDRFHFRPLRDLDVAERGRSRLGCRHD